MKTRFLLLGPPLACAVLLAGCQGRIRPKRAELPPTEELRISYRTIDGRQRLFTNVGFSLFDALLRGRLLAAYDSKGVLDRAALEKAIPEAKISGTPDLGYVRFVIPNSPFSEILLTDGPLLSVHPTMDAVLMLLMEQTKTTAQANSSQIPLILPLPVSRR
jgi:hypothetical protein